MFYLTSTHEHHANKFYANVIIRVLTKIQLAELIHWNWNNMIELKHNTAVFSWGNVEFTSIKKKTLKILTGKTHPQLKPKVLRKYSGTVNQLFLRSSYRN